MGPLIPNESAQLQVQRYNMFYKNKAGVLLNLKVQMKSDPQADIVTIWTGRTCERIGTDFGKGHKQECSLSKCVSEGKMSRE
jgi:hypothetical protein